MDPRRLDTMQIIREGFLNKPIEETDEPKDRETASGADWDWSCPSEETVVAALEAGKLVSSANDYGYPKTWKKSDGVYRCILWQYCSITENETFTTAEEAAEWFVEKYRAT